VFEARCGKGTYVRAIARDLGRALGCLGHVTALRRTRVGPFSELDAVTLAEVDEHPETAPEFLRPVEAGLTEVACVVVDRDGAARLRRGQSLILRGRDAPFEGAAYASCGGVPVAFGSVEHGELVPSRVFNLPI
jgi:tRNA pseudouridine55 synthase